MMNPRIFLTLVAFGMVFSMTGMAQEAPEFEPLSSEANIERDGHKGKFRSAKHRKRIAEFMLKRIDVNKDGKVDINEFLQHSEQRFQAMDIDSNGYVTPDEAQQAHKLIREKFRQAYKDQRRSEKGKEATSDQ